MTSRLVLLLEVKASFLKGSLVLLWLSTRIPGSLWLSTQIPGSLCRTSPVRVTETAIANFKWPTTQGAFGTSQYSFWVPFFQEIKLIMTTGNAPSWAFQEFKVKKRHGRIFYLDHLTWQSSTLRPELVVPLPSLLMRKQEVSFPAEVLWRVTARRRKASPLAL